jgi:hypothetical protein
MMLNDFLAFKEVAFKEGGAGDGVNDLRLWTSPCPKNRRIGGFDAIRSYLGPKNAVGRKARGHVVRTYVHMTLTLKLPLGANCQYVDSSWH